MEFSRRQLLAMGAGSALGLAFSRRAYAQTTSRRACILLYMEGGPSHIDTWDPKPGSATGGPFKAISTTVDGIQISEHLPQLSARMKDLAIVRSVTSREGNHDRARYLMHTGHSPEGGVDHPSLGSLVSQLHGTNELPGYVSIAGPGEDAGFLGAAWAPFPVRNPLKGVKNLRPPENVDEKRFTSRLALWRGMQDRFISRHQGVVTFGQKAVTEQAISMMQSTRSDVFDVLQEPETTRLRYGDTPFQSGCLLARRLVEGGVPFVEVTLRGWDTHKDNFATVERLSAELDRGMTSLLDDLKARGLLGSTLVVCMGDFGRTPKINDNGGRDHHPRASSVVLAGAGIKAGQVIGSTDDDGDQVTTRPVSVSDLFRTVDGIVGLNADEVRTAPSGRPINTVDGGTRIQELVG